MQEYSACLEPLPGRQVELDELIEGGGRLVRADLFVAFCFERSGL